MNDATDDAALQAEAQAAELRARKGEARRKWLRRLALFVGIAGLLWAAWYFLIGKNHVSTDNAYVNAEMAIVTPLIAGTVTAVHVKDTQSVRRGDILVELDPANARIAVAAAEAELADARRRFRRAVATNGALSAQIAARSAGVAQSQAQLAAARAEAAKASIDLRRAGPLARDGIISAEQFGSAQKGNDLARAAVAAAEAAIAQAQSGRSAAIGEFAANDAMVRGSDESSDPAVLAAQARLESARLDLDRMAIRAPVDGTVTRRQVQLGQRVAQGQSVMTIVPIAQVYVDANFKERQLRRVRVGMPAKVTADLYGGDVVYRGKVAGIAGGTGASMSMIPAQNATGNWIKVVQRLPVRIELDPKELAAHPLRVGLSTEVEIDLSGN